MLPFRRAAAVALSAALAGLVTACDAEQLGAAAVVGGERITVMELQDEVREVTRIAGRDVTADQSTVQATVLNRMINHRLGDTVAELADVTVTEAEVDEFIAEQLRPQAPEGDLTQLLAQNLLTEDSLRYAVREALLIEKVGGNDAYVELLAEASEKDGVEVSPRYGTWTGTMLDTEVSGSISVPAAELAQDAPTGQ